MQKKKVAETGTPGQPADSAQPIPASNISAGVDRALTRHRDSGSPDAEKP
jgi:hypothetical protein